MCRTLSEIPWNGAPLRQNCFKNKTLRSISALLRNKLRYVRILTPGMTPSFFPLHYI